MENLGFGIQISLMGMGLVFGLLALLWGVLVLVGRLDQRAPAPAATATRPAAQPVNTATQPPPPATATLDPEVRAAIMVAVALHRASGRRQAAPVMRSYWPGSLLYASRWVMTGRARQNRTWRRGG